MEIFVDGDRIDDQAFDDVSVGEALQRIQLQCCPADHLVVGLRCDEREVPSNAMAATLQEPVSQFERLDVLTSTKSALVGEAMTEATASLNEADTECEEVTRLLSQGDTAEGIERLGVCLGAWRQIHEAVAKSIQMLALDPETCLVGDESLATMIARPIGVLTQIKEALTAQDYVLLADTLQYEIGEITELWRAIATWLLQEADEASRGGS